MQFPFYRNRFTEHLLAGFDVHGDLVAAANDDGCVTIWDVKRGFRVAQTCSMNPTPMTRVTSLQFIGGEKDWRAKRLMIATGSTVGDFSWGTVVVEA